MTSGLNREPEKKKVQTTGGLAVEVRCRLRLVLGSAAAVPQRVCRPPLVRPPRRSGFASPAPRRPARHENLVALARRLIGRRRDRREDAALAARQPHEQRRSSSALMPAYWREVVDAERDLGAGRRDEVLENRAPPRRARLR